MSNMEKLTNINKDANLDIEAPTVVEPEFPHESATVKTGRLNKCPKKGEADQDKNSLVTTIQENELGALYITVPHILIEKMGWNKDDKLCLSTTLNCFDWGKVDSIVLRNLSKEIDE